MCKKTKNAFFARKRTLRTHKQKPPEPRRTPSPPQMKRAHSDTTSDTTSEDKPLKKPPVEENENKAEDGLSEGMVLILDTSQSMYHLYDKFSKAVEILLKTRVKAGSPVTIVWFNGKIKIVDCTDTDTAVEKVQAPKFGCGTALYAAVERGMAHGLKKHKGVNVTAVILTDGENNCEPESPSGAQSQVAAAREKGWHVMFLGVTENAFQAGSALGVGADHSLSVSVSSQATVEAFAAVSSSSRRFASGDSSGFTRAERVASSLE